MEDSKLENKKLCECGCGEEIPLWSKHRSNQRQRFKHGHNDTGAGFKKGHPYGKRFKKGENTRELHHNWKNGRMFDKGYLLLLRPDHHSGRKRGYIREHRLIYEEHHKCSLLPWAVIHHVNGKKDDNKADNLIGMTRRQHIELHRDDLKDDVC